MAAITVQSPTAVGGALTYTAVSASDTFAAAAGQRYLLLYRNTGGGACVPTVDDPNTLSPTGATAFNPDLAGASVAATTGVNFMLIDGSRFRDGTTGNVTVAHSATASVTLAIVGPF